MQGEARVNYTDGIAEYIGRQVAKINTLAIGKITKVDLITWRADVRLKAKVGDQEIEIANVPIALQKFGAGAVHIAPTVGDIVLIGFSTREVKKQLRNRDIVAVNELVLHNVNHAIILSGIYVDSDTVQPISAGEMLISHKSGSYLKFKVDGGIEIYSPSSDVNVRYPT